MSIINKKDVVKLDAGSVVSGYALVQNYNLLPQKNGGHYISGQLQANGQLPFKVWSDSNADSAFARLNFRGDEYKNTICRVSGKVDKFGGVDSLVLNSIDVVDSKALGLSESDFLEEVYDISTWWGMLTNTLGKYCSDKAYQLFIDLMAPIKERFIVEFAAVHHHDNCKSGLLAHTTKVVRMASLIKMYPELMKRVSADTLFLSCALHDIGKIYEYCNGAVSPDGQILSHHTFGVLFLNENRNLIIDTMGEKFYYTLLSVVEQHHGEWGERPRTLVAYLVHLLDNLDATLTSLNSLIADNSEQIQYNGFKLI